MKVQGNSGETQNIKWRETGGKLKIEFFTQYENMENIFLMPRKVQGNCRETGGKLKNTFLRPIKVQGN